MKLVCPRLGILTAAAASRAQSVHLAGSVATNGTNVSLDVIIARPKGFSGTITLEGKGKFGITTVAGSGFYLTPDAQAWASVGNNNPAFLQLVAGRCFTATSGDSGFGGLVSGLSAFTNFDELFGKIIGDSSLTKGPITTVNGQPAIELKTGDGSLLDVATSGAPYPIEISKSGPPGGKLDFDQWNAVRAVNAPTGCVPLRALVGGHASPTP
jgi:hypothetical protein